MAGELKYGIVISAAVAGAVAGLKTVGLGLSNLGDKSKAAGDQLEKTAEKLRVARENVDAFTGMVKDGLGSVLAPAAAVDASMAKLAVHTKSLGMVEVYDQAKAAALAWSQTHTQSAAQFIDATTAMSAVGLKQADVIKATETAMRLAAATGGDAAATAQTLGAIYNQAGDKTKDAGAEMARLGDQLARLKQLFPQVNVADLSDPLKDALPAAKAAKVDFGQLVTIIGQFNAAGIKGGEAGAATAKLIDSMGGASKALGFSLVKAKDGGLDLVSTLANLEKKYGPVSKMTPEVQKKLQDAFGPDAFKGLSMMLGQTQALGDAMGSMSQSAGAAASAQAALEDTTAAKAQIAQQQVEALKVELAAGLAPAIGQLLPIVKQGVEAFSGFVKDHPELVKLVGTVAIFAVAAGSVIGPIISGAGALASLGSIIMGTVIPAVVSAAGWIIGTMVPALISGAASAWAFAAALLANPITWIVLAIIALAAVIYIYWEPISKFFIELWSKVKVYFVAAWNVILGMWSKVTSFLGGIWAEIKGAFQESFVKGVFTVLKYLSPITWIVKAFGAILPWLTRLWDDVKAGFKVGFVEGLTRLFMNFTPWGWIYRGWNALTQWLFGLSLKDAALKVLDSLLDGLAYAWKRLPDWLMTLNQWMFEGMKLLGGIVLDALVWLGKATWNGFKALGGIIADFFSFFAQGIKNDLGRVGDFVGGIWQRITSAFDGGVAGVLRLLLEFNPLAIMAKAWDAVLQYLFGFSLAEAGANIVGTIVDGITSMAQGPVDAMKDIVQKVRNLLPFSPAKDGPLRDLHKVKLVETVADSVDGAPLVNAMSGVAGEAMAAVQSAPIPTSVGQGRGAAAAAPGAAAPGGGIQMSVTIHVGSGADKGVVEELEAWIRNPSNAARLADAVQRANATSARAEMR